MTRDEGNRGHETWREMRTSDDRELDREQGAKENDRQRKERLGQNNQGKGEEGEHDESIQRTNGRTGGEACGFGQPVGSPSAGIISGP